MAPTSSSSSSLGPSAPKLTVTTTPAAPTSSASPIAASSPSTTASVVIRRQNAAGKSGGLPAILTPHEDQHQGQRQGPTTPTIPTGNANSRSFWFLLTLALEKAKIAVEHDNQGHVAEAIKLYQDSINLLGVVYHRTQEEDHRSRLRHFRDTYSERIAILQAASPLHSPNPQADTDAKPKLVARDHIPQQQQQQLLLMQTYQGKSGATPNSTNPGGAIERALGSKNNTLNPSPSPTIDDPSSIASYDNSAAAKPHIPRHRDFLPRSLVTTPLKHSTSERHRQSRSFDSRYLFGLRGPTGNGEVAIPDIPANRFRSFSNDNNNADPPLASVPHALPSAENGHPTPVEGLEASSDADKQRVHHSVSRALDSSDPTRDSGGSPTGSSQSPQQQQLAAPDDTDEHTPDSQRLKALRSQRSLPALLGFSRQVSSGPTPTVDAPEPVPPLPNFARHQLSLSNASETTALTTTASEKDPSVYKQHRKRLSTARIVPTRGIGRRLLASIRPGSSNRAASQAPVSPKSTSFEHAQDGQDDSLSLAPSIPKPTIAELKRSSSIDSSSSTSIIDFVPLSRLRSKTLESSIELINTADEVSQQQQQGSVAASHVNSRSMSASNTLKKEYSQTSVLSNGISKDALSLSSSRQPSRQTTGNVARIRDWFQSGGAQNNNNNNSNIGSNGNGNGNQEPYQEGIRSTPSGNKLASLFRRKQSVASMNGVDARGKPSSPPEHNSVSSLAGTASSARQLFTMTRVISSRKNTNSSVATFAATGSSPQQPPPPPSASTDSASQQAQQAATQSSGTTLTSAQLSTSRAKKRMSLFSNSSSNSDSKKDMSKSRTHSWMLPTIAATPSGITHASNPSSRVSEDESTEDTSSPVHAVKTLAFIEGTNSYRGEGHKGGATNPQDSRDRQQHQSLLSILPAQNAPRPPPPLLLLEAVDGLPLPLVPKTPPLPTPEQNQQMIYAGRVTLDEVESDIHAAVAKQQVTATGGGGGEILCNPPPRISPLFPYWKVRMLLTSIIRSGAYITPSLYIPRRIWFQTEIRVYAVETKLAAIEQIVFTLSQAQSITLPELSLLFTTAPASATDDDGGQHRRREAEMLAAACMEVTQWLDEVERMAEQVRRMLSKKLKFISPARQGFQHGAAVAGHHQRQMSTTMASMGSPKSPNLDQGSGSDQVFGSDSVPPAGGAAAAGEAGNGSTGRQQPGHYRGSNAATISGGGGSHSKNCGTPQAASGDAFTWNDTTPTAAAERRDSSIDGASIHNTQRQLVITRDSRGQMNTDASGHYHYASSMLSVSSNSQSIANGPSGRFRGLGKLGKSVDRLYSNMQKDKMDDTTIYTLALQRLFTAILAIEGWYGYFGRLSRIPAVQELFDRPSPPLDNSGGGDSSSGSGSSSADVAGKDSTIRPTAAVSPASLYLRLVRLSEWSDQVIVAWVIRDVQVMLGKYIKRLRESMTE